MERYQYSKTALSRKEPLRTGICCGDYGRKTASVEDRHMDHFGGLFERAYEGAMAVGAHEQHSGIQSVQNLEAVINECLRVALLE